MRSRSMGDGFVGVGVGIPVDRLEVKQKCVGEGMEDEMLSFVLKSERGEAIG